MADSNNLSEADLLAMAQAADNGTEWKPKEADEVKEEPKAEDKPAENIEQKPAPAEEAETKQDASSEAPAPKEESKDAKSSLTTESSETKSESASEKKPSRYQRSLSRLEKEWDSLKQKEAILKAREDAIAAKEANREAPQPSTEAPKTGSRKYSAEDYRYAAKSLREEGRDDLADLAENKATEAESEERKELEQKTQAELKSAWDKNLLDEVEANPDLRDSNSKLYKAVNEMLQNHAILRNYPAGIKDAVGIAKIRLKADAASDLEKKVQEYEQELAQLRKATTPASGQPSAPAKTKAFHELSMEEQEQKLLEMAGQIDRA